MPSGTVAFTLMSGSLLRGLKFQDGEVIANYAFPMNGGEQKNISTPPYIAPPKYGVVISADDASQLGSTWVADLEVDGKSTGQCTPKP